MTFSWEQRKLSDAVDVRSGCDYKNLSAGTIPVYGTGGYMLSVDKALSYSDDAVGIGRKGTIDKPYILRAPFWTVDTLFYAVPRTKYDLQFLFGIFQKVDWKKKDESTGVPSLSKQTINTVDITVPENLEQQKIGMFFQYIDQLITLHQRNDFFVKAPKNLEISLQKTVAWEQRELGKTCVITTGGTPTTSISNYWNPKEIPWLSSGEVNKKRISETDDRISRQGLENSSARWVKPYSVLIALAGQGKTRGTVAINEIALTTNQSIAAIYPEEHDAEFLFQNLESRYEELRAISSADGSRGGLNKNLLSSVFIPYTETQEQLKIGFFFKSLDYLITLHQRELDRLQKIKKSCLEKMFV